jgi:hypothetical protein
VCTRACVCMCVFERQRVTEEQKIIKIGKLSRECGIWVIQEISKEQTQSLIKE